jgi:hypothetical protein
MAGRSRDYILARYTYLRLLFMILNAHKRHEPSALAKDFQTYRPDGLNPLTGKRDVTFANHLLDYKNHKQPLTTSEDGLNDLYDCVKTRYERIMDEQELERWMIPLLRHCFDSEYTTTSNYNPIEPFSFLFSDLRREEYAELANNHEGLYHYVRPTSYMERVISKCEFVRGFIKIYQWNKQQVTPTYSNFYRKPNSTDLDVREMRGSISQSGQHLYLISQEESRSELSYMIWPYSRNGISVGHDGVFHGVVTAVDPTGEIFSTIMACRRLTTSQKSRKVNVNERYQEDQKWRALENDEMEKLGVFSATSEDLRLDTVRVLVEKIRSLPENKSRIGDFGNIE